MRLSRVRRLGLVAGVDRDLYDVGRRGRLGVGYLRRGSGVSARSLMPQPGHRSFVEGMPQPGHRTESSVSWRAQRFQLGSDVGAGAEGECPLGAACDSATGVGAATGGMAKVVATEDTAATGSAVAAPAATVTGPAGTGPAGTGPGVTGPAVTGVGEGLRGEPSADRGSATTRARTTSRTGPATGEGRWARGAGWPSGRGSPHSKQKSWSGTTSAWQLVHRTTPSYQLSGPREGGQIC